MSNPCLRHVYYTLLHVYPISTPCPQYVYSMSAPCLLHVHSMSNSMSILCILHIYSCLRCLFTHQFQTMRTKIHALIELDTFAIMILFFPSVVSVFHKYVKSTITHSNHIKGSSKKFIHTLTGNYIDPAIKLVYIYFGGSCKLVKLSVCFPINWHFHFTFSNILSSF